MSVCVYLQPRDGQTGDQMTSVEQRVVDACNAAGVEPGVIRLADQNMASPDIDPSNGWLHGAPDGTITYVSGEFAQDELYTSLNEIQDGFFYVGPGGREAALRMLGDEYVEIHSPADFESLLAAAVRGGFDNPALLAFRRPIIDNCEEAPPDVATADPKAKKGCPGVLWPTPPVPEWMTLLTR